MATVDKIDIPLPPDPERQNGTISPIQKNGKLKNSFHRHSQEIEEIISNRPPFLVRWGLVLFFILFLMIGLISWLIPYPDVIKSSATLIGIYAPKTLQTYTEGDLKQLLIKDGDTVSADQVCAVMESRADVQAMHRLQIVLDSMHALIQQKEYDQFLHFYSGQTKILSNKTDLGELQSDFQAFDAAYLTYKDYLQSGFFLKKRKMLDEDLIRYTKNKSILEEQKILSSQDLALSDSTLKVNIKLAEQKVISALDLRNEKSKHINKQMALPQLNASLLSLDGQILEKNKEIAELDNTIANQQNIFIQTLQVLKSKINEWKHTFLVTSPIAGKLSFIGFLQENQHISLGQKLFYVQPPNAEYMMEMMIPQYNFGKVKIGQEVQFRFQAYPFEQFGVVKGAISYIALHPTDSGFQAKVTLPHGLTTNYNKSIQFRHGLSAQAAIITEQMRLMEKIYFDVIKNFKKN